MTKSMNIYNIRSHITFLLKETKLFCNDIPFLCKHGRFIIFYASLVEVFDRLFLHENRAPYYVFVTFGSPNTHRKVAAVVVVMQTNMAKTAIKNPTRKIMASVQMPEEHCPDVAIGCP
jgi:hypothetical protein